MRNHILFVVGICCVILGIAGLFLPILQGILLIVAGLLFMNGLLKNRHISKLEGWLERKKATLRKARFRHRKKRSDTESQS